ncbi:MAG: hypothetical protein RLZZ398_192 [Verrucomicrobiota bacterium]|jgi:hypothetical protein
MRNACASRPRSCAEEINSNARFAKYAMRGHRLPNVRRGNPKTGYPDISAIRATSRADAEAGIEF